MSEWVWVKLSAVLAAHDRLLADYGGSEGIRDMGSLEGALGRPINLVAYDSPDISELAALYAVGITKAHAFVDGNKRTAWATTRAFLLLNGYTLRFDKTDAVHQMELIAKSETTAAEFAAWIRARMERR